MQRDQGGLQERVSELLLPQRNISLSGRVLRDMPPAAGPRREQLHLRFVRDQLRGQRGLPEHIAGELPDIREILRFLVPGRRQAAERDDDVLNHAVCNRLQPDSGRVEH